MNQSDPILQGWTPSPDGRGTLDIVWACLFTIIICCWTVIHPDTPHPSAGEWRRLSEKFFCLCLAILCPEAILAMAWGDWTTARSPLPEGMTITHGFLANMGGIAVCTGNDASQSESPDSFLNCRMLRELDRHGFAIDVISERDIRDKAKSDAFVKLFAVAQALYLAAQCIARSIEKLDITLLEVSTVAYLPCSLLAYFFWWHKPFDVLFPIAVWPRLKEAPFSSGEAKAYQDHILTSTTVAVPATAAAIAHPPLDAAAVLSTLSPPRYQLHPLAKKIFRTGVPLSEDVAWESSFPRFYFADFGAVAAGGGMLFGGVHYAAWAFAFPSEVERWCWRASCVVLTVSPAVAWLLGGLLFRLYEVDIWKQRVWYCIACRWMSGTAFALYVLARLFLLFEVFFALRASPASCYESVDWTRFLPHVS